MIATLSLTVATNGTTVVATGAAIVGIGGGCVGDGGGVTAISCAGTTSSTGGAPSPEAWLWKSYLQTSQKRLSSGFGVPQSGQIRPPAEGAD
jgi:hypothetical protein